MSASANDDCDHLIATGLLKHFCKLERFNGQLISPEFAKKLESNDFLRKAFEADPMKVIQENNVELSLQDLENISGGAEFHAKKAPPKVGPGVTPPPNVKNK